MKHREDGLTQWATTVVQLTSVVACVQAIVDMPNSSIGVKARENDNEASDTSDDFHSATVNLETGFKPILWPTSSSPVGDNDVETITLTKEVPVPFPVTVEKRIPIRIEVPVDKPYPVYVPRPYEVVVEKKIPYEVKVPIPQPYTVEKHVPVPVKVQVPRPYPVHVPQPYPVFVVKKVPYTIEKQIPYAVRVPYVRPYPVHVPVEKQVPYPVEKVVPYPVHVHVDRPIPVAVEKPVPVPVEKPIPVPVERIVPVPIRIPVQIPVHVHAMPHYPQSGSETNNNAHYYWTSAGETGDSNLQSQIQQGEETNHHKTLIRGTVKYHDTAKNEESHSSDHQEPMPYDHQRIIMYNMPNLQTHNQGDYHQDLRNHKNQIASHDYSQSPISTNRTFNFNQGKEDVNNHQVDSTLNHNYANSSISPTIGDYRDGLPLPQQHELHRQPVKYAYGNAHDEDHTNFHTTKTNNYSYDDPSSWRQESYFKVNMGALTFTNSIQHGSSHS